MLPSLSLMDFEVIEGDPGVLRACPAPVPTPVSPDSVSLNLICSCARCPDCEGTDSAGKCSPIFPRATPLQAQDNELRRGHTCLYTSTHKIKTKPSHKTAHTLQPKRYRRNKASWFPLFSAEGCILEGILRMGGIDVWKPLRV